MQPQSTTADQGSPCGLGALDLDAHFIPLYPDAVASLPDAFTLADFARAYRAEGGGFTDVIRDLSMQCTLGRVRRVGEGGYERVPDAECPRALGAVVGTPYDLGRIYCAAGRPASAAEGLYDDEEARRSFIDGWRYEVEAMHDRNLSPEPVPYVLIAASAAMEGDGADTPYEVVEWGEEEEEEEEAEETVANRFEDFALAVFDKLRGSSFSALRVYREVGLGMDMDKGEVHRMMGLLSRHGLIRSTTIGLYIVPLCHRDVYERVVEDLADDMAEEEEEQAEPRPAKARLNAAGRRHGGQPQQPVDRVELRGRTLAVHLTHYGMTKALRFRGDRAVEVLAANGFNIDGRVFCRLFDDADDPRIEAMIEDLTAPAGVAHA